MLRPILAAVAMMSASAALAQDTGVSSASGGSASMASLLSQGYEIKSSVQNGSKTIVFLQKDKTAYACEFVSLTRSRCGSIN